ncbi:polynucleotide 5'-hydroxyl-kinase [Malassezia sp. CBS 17886]|nr:polynucleotide 5'-hydroxyl-kinase [Malassezia sp. CBS 17886]
MSTDGHRRVQLPPRSEYRIELEVGESVAVRSVADPVSGHYGDAEVFGAPMIAGPQDRWYTFGNEAKFAISSWGGGAVDIAGFATTEYMADEPSPVYTYWANLHLYAEKARFRAREQLRTDPALVHALQELNVADAGAPAPHEADAAPPEHPIYRAAGQGPRIMVVGPESAGKTTLIKLLANYAMRSPAVASLEQTGRRERAPRTPGDDEDEDDGGGGGGGDGDDAKADATPGDQSEVTGWWPLVVSVDPSEGAVPVPGCVSAVPLAPTPVSALPSASPALPYGVTIQTSGALPPGVSAAHSVMPLVHWLGKGNVRENERHSRRVIDWLADNVERRIAKDLRARMSGLLIDMPAVITADARARYSFLQYCARALKVDVVVVLGHEKLNLELTRVFAGDTSGAAPQVVKVPKSGGVCGVWRALTVQAVEVDDVYKQRLQDLKVRSYFYGLGPVQADSSLGAGANPAPVHPLPGHADALGGVPALNPYSTTIPFDLLEIYRIGQDSVAPSSALPIGAERVLSELQVVKLDPANSTSDLNSLLHTVLALVEPPHGGGGPGQADSTTEPTDDELLGASVVGLLLVSDIDHVKRKLTVLAPKPGKFPSKTALIGNLHWQDT